MPPKSGHHKNTTAWVAHQHQEYKKPSAESLKGAVDHCCEKCVDVIEWRQKYGKYKALAAATKCHCCREKTVIKAYHGLCQPCCWKKQLCAKCEKPFVGDSSGFAREQREAELRQQLLRLPERYRRSAERKLTKGEDLVEVEKVIERALNRKGRRDGDADADASSGDEEATAAVPAHPGASGAESPKPVLPKEPPAPAAGDSDSDEVM
ncbi:hypothetical protein DIPPA_07320 [Diplonema papillatum]|nr:hypothetical protein DIPPA_07320 [Diplonema papillatum]